MGETRTDGERCGVWFSLGLGASVSSSVTWGWEAQPTLAGLKPLVSPGTFPGSQPQAPASPGLPARPPPPSPPRRPIPPRQGPAGSGRRECYFDTAAPDACDNILARNVTWQECCCTVGEGWGSGCRIQQCPSTETGGHGLLGGHRAEGLGRNRQACDWDRGRIWTWAGALVPYGQE